MRTLKAGRLEVTIAMYAIWLKDSREHIIGQTNIGGYQQAAVVCGAVILVSLLFCTAGLHPERFLIFII